MVDPCLALAIHGLATPDGLELLPLQAHFWQHIAAHAAPKHRAGRLKQ